MASYSGNSISTELIQKYLDENMQLIIATLYKQNQSNLNESALYVSNSRHLICQQNFMKVSSKVAAES
ncbi:GRF1-interacting factor 3-like isoform X2 [Physcomitrium patens]|uniref:GRF1-interacting factor 3-like isoform X2 n=1 Tax=Physcomitrium patens TaxID=3218 RepID=UPI003CCCE4FA